MIKHVPFEELQSRLRRFRNTMEKIHPDWEMTIIISKINIFYFTGTMQEGMLMIPREGEPLYFVRRSYERALDESLFPTIFPMNSFRDAAKVVKKMPRCVYMETEIVPLALYKRFQKYFPVEEVKSVDAAIAAVRAVKSEYELALIKQSGRIHQRILEELVPDLLELGISEVELAGRLFSLMLQEGHHGVARFGMFDTEIGLGHVCFGESSIYPTSFNGPGGNYGMNPAVPLIGSHNNTLKEGDLVFIDVACGVEGYHTDKTMTYMFRRFLPDEVIDIHNRCVAIQNQMAAMLKPGVRPSDIYRTALADLEEDFMKNFMGFGQRKVKFLGHGVGLVIDEYPVIAEGFDEPLQEGMVIALEPKKGIKGIGMVGVENTFLVTRKGGQCITGDHPGLIPV